MTKIKHTIIINSKFNPNFVYMSKYNVYILYQVKTRIGK